MSHSDLSPGYNPYFQQYGTPSNVQAPSDPYQNAGQSAAGPISTSRDTGYLNTPQQYGSGADPRAYDGSVWRGNYNQVAYEYQRPSEKNVTAPSHARTMSEYSAPSSQSLEQLSTQALNSLAYASGLESAGLQVQRSPVTGGDDVRSNQSYPLNRAASRAQNTGQYYTSQARPSSRSHYGDNSIANSAAAALAGAVNRKYGNAQQSPSFTQADTTASVVNIGTTNSRVATSTVQLAVAVQSPPTTQPSQTRTPTSQHNRQKLSQSSKNYVIAQTHRCENSACLSQASTATPSHSSRHVDGQTEVADRNSPNAQPRPQNTSSIANLVRSQSPSQQTQRTYQSIEDQSPTMPNFIDPSQVFNPYHMEFEEQKSRAEAERQAQKQRIAFVPVQPPDTGPGTSTTTQWSGSAATSDGSTNIPVNREVQARTIAQANQSGNGKAGDGTDNTASVTAPTENVAEDVEEMATEMKAMLDKMRDFKTKDPALFQKLWEDMKKPAVSTPATSPQNPQIVLPANPSLPTAWPRSKPKSKPFDTTPLGPSLTDRSNGYQVFCEDNPESLPDLGRFPAETSYRESYHKKPSAPSAGAEVADTSPSALPSTSRTTSPQNHAFTPPPQASLTPSQPIHHSSPQTTSLPIPQPAAQPLPQPISNGQTAWPAERRKTLAKAAIVVLNEHKENKGTSVTARTIYEMIRRNPSYIELCKMLESRGMKFHRTQFARKLLQAVPDLASQAKSPSELQSKLAPVRAQVQQTYLTPAGAPPAAPGPGKLEKGNVFHSAAQPVLPYGSGPPKQLPPAPGPAKSRPGVPVPIIPAPVPGSKEAMARKRDFSELVDLTHLDDDDDYVLSNKRSRVEDSSPEPEGFKAQPKIPFRTLQHPPDIANRIGTSGQAIQPARPRAILARKIWKHEALRKSYYDPKTVARDVLIAAGRHPSERPLNAHLAGLLHRCIEIDSDLSTFDWDAVTPGGPPMPRVELADVPAGRPKWKVDMRKTRTLTPSRDIPKQPIRDRPPSGLGATAHSQLSAQTKKLLKESRNRTSNPSQLRQVHMPGDDSEPEISVVIAPENAPRSAPQTASNPSFTTPSPDFARPDNATSESSSMESSGYYPSGKRRGRPPGSKNKAPSVKKSAHTGGPWSSLTHSSLPAPEYSTYDCRWRKCHAKLHNLPTLRQHVSKKHQFRPEEVQQYGWTCWWKQCSTLVQNTDKTYTANVHFDNYDEWMAHIETKHLHPIGMEKGDGPASSHTDPQTLAANASKYLADAQHRRVTAPSSNATIRHYPADTLVLTSVSKDNQDRIPIKAFHKTHGNDKMDAKPSAAAVLHAMEVRKERVGPGLDRGGCTLVNAARRGTLVQNEGLARVVDGDY